MGVVSPVGNELDSFFGNLCAGKSGITAIESFECEDWPTRIAGEVKDFEPGDLISKKMARRLDRAIMFSLYAGKKALLDAGLPIDFKECAFGSYFCLHIAFNRCTGCQWSVLHLLPQFGRTATYEMCRKQNVFTRQAWAVPFFLHIASVDFVSTVLYALFSSRPLSSRQTRCCRDSAGINVHRAGVLVGTAFGGIASFASGCSMLLKNHKKMNPFCIPFAITNMGSAMLAMDTGLMGPNYSISSACATGNYCMLNAVNHIRAGEADVMLAGATDAAIIPEGTIHPARHTH